MFCVVDGVDCAAELSLTLHLIDGLELAELFPRRSHQLLLLALDDGGAEGSDCPMAGIQVQFIEPCQRSRRSGAGLYEVSRRLPATINRRRDQRFRALLFHRQPWCIQYSLELGLKRCSCLLRPFGDWDVREAQRTIKLERQPEKAPEAPAARAIAVDTQLPLAPLFDATAALKRIRDASGGELAHAPRPVGVLRRLWSDPPPRRLALSALLALAAGAFVALL